ncbi:MAG: 3-phosphoshikimate 1-carboxyvinyltransferase [Spirochaetales bacterium]|nr:3-phosphoshikimate 1-carboxyvinyltransferase [Spirochaetales bacterium]
MTRLIEPGTVRGRIRVPASKSAMQRAIACAAMARGQSTITNPTWCADSIAAMRVASALGATIERLNDRVLVRGGFKPEGPVVASCGESGLCLRMFSAIAALLPVDVELRGEGSLAMRPVGMVQAPLEALGVSCDTAAGFQPVRVRGPIRPGPVTLDASDSSQFLTGLLVALPMAGGNSSISVHKLASRGYIDLTLDVMRAFGAEADRDHDYGEFRVRGTPYQPATYEVEGDWSGAAFPLVAGAIAGSRPSPGLDVVGLSPASSQPDRAIIDALSMAGARLERLPDGYRVLPAPLSAFSFDASDCPDLFPPLVALASRCQGVTKLVGASRLRAKESDRAAALSEEFGRLGLDVRVNGDEMTVRGSDVTDTASRLVRGGRVSSRGDHRIAMAAAVAALAAAGPVAIDDAEAVSKSWPDFFEALSGMYTPPSLNSSV